MTNLFLFGNSITWGAEDPAGGWAARLRKWLEEQTHLVTVYNLGVCGDTSADLLARFQFEFESRRSAVDPNPILFAIGLNDTSRSKPRGKTQVSLSDFKKNITALAEQASQYNEKIAFLGLTPVWEQRIKDNALPGSQIVWYDNKTIAKYNQELKEVCKQNIIPFIEVFDLLEQKDIDNDGIHPNAKGHQKIFEQVKDFIVKNKFVSF